MARVGRAVAFTGGVLGIGEVPTAETGFAQIIDGRPDEVANDVGIVVDHRPIVECLMRIGFRASHNAGGDALTVVAVALEIIVVAADIESCVEAVGGRLVGDQIESGSDGARGIEGTQVICEDPGFLCTQRFAAFGDFVADAPHHDRWVIAVAQDHGIDVPLPPIVKDDVVIFRVLALRPAIKGFVEHHHAEPVAGGQECRRGRIVGGANAGESGFFEDLDAALLGAIEGGGAQRSVVVVNAPPGQLDGFPVEQESFFGGPFERANAEWRDDFVYRFSVD